jgi:hypothetical protein
MMIKTLAALLGAPLFLAASAAQARDENWLRHGQFERVDRSCTQQWDCVPRHPVLHGDDSRIVTTPSETTSGTCLAGNAPIGECSVCSAPIPKTPCDWTLESR